MRRSCTTFCTSAPLVRYMLIRRGTRGALEYLHGESPPAVAAFYPLCASFFFFFAELCCRTKLRCHALAAGCYNSFFGEGEERNHRDCRHRGSAQRFTGEGLCNPMLNSASDLWGSCVKPVCFSCLYFCCAPQKLTIAHGFSAISPSRHNVPGC